MPKNNSSVYVVQKRKEGPHENTGEMGIIFYNLLEIINMADISDRIFLPCYTNFRATTAMWKRAIEFSGTFCIRVFKL